MEKKMAAATGKFIIVTGPESTGKTTIAEKLAVHFQGKLYPEYARNYIEKLNRNYTYSDIEAIARYQYQQYELFVQDKKLSIFDTYLIITKVWFIWHASKYPVWLDKAIEQTSNALYLLCSPDIEWIPDNVRENGGAARLELFKQYTRELQYYGLNYQIITGQGDIRNENALHIAANYLKKENV
jgi:NadR type nicotinamide-nucleotide adenylyltransferase